MWIILNKTFMSIVENRHNKNELLVRSRVKGDIEEVFPDADVLENIGTDYLFRAFIPRSTVSEAIKKEVDMIDYDNFKDSVPKSDIKRLNSYMSVWSNLRHLQD
tara:strand:+ start:244 stop:555 length:312 start_codon:yes stop_codon:yes gene_type:complete